MAAVQGDIAVSVSSSLVLLILLLIKDSKGECDLQYEKEPLTQPGCNPYQTGSLLLLQCDLRLQPIIPRSDLQILWYFSEGGGIQDRVIDVTSFPPLVQLSTRDVSENLLSSSVSFNGSLLRPSSHAGGYYCRPILNNATSPFTSSNRIVLASSYSDNRSCVDFQVQNTTRCAGNIESSDPTVLSAITTEGNSILVTRQRKVKLREIEEDLHIGIYLLILVIVVVLCLSFVILTVLLTRKCDKKKGASKQETGQNNDNGMEECTECPEGSPARSNEPRVEETNIDTYERLSNLEVEVAAHTLEDKEKSDSKNTQNANKSRISAIFTPLPHEPVQMNGDKSTESVVRSNHLHNDDAIYEEVPENCQKPWVLPGASSAPSTKVCEDQNKKKSLTPPLEIGNSKYHRTDHGDKSHSKLPPLPFRSGKTTISSEFQTMKSEGPIKAVLPAPSTIPEQKQKTTTKLPKEFPVVTPRSSITTKHSVNSQVVFPEVLEATGESTLYDTVDDTSREEMPKMSQPKEESTYDFIPPSDGIVTRNMSYGVSCGAGSATRTKPADEIYESMDGHNESMDGQNESTYYTAMH